MFEGASIQFVTDLAEAKSELEAAGLDWPLVKILGDDDAEEEDTSAEAISSSNGGVALYIDSIDLIIKARVEKAREIIETVAKIIQYFNAKGETAVLFFHMSWETYMVDQEKN